jgi:hypothetical protein
MERIHSSLWILLISNTVNQANQNDAAKVFEEEWIDESLLISPIKSNNPRETNEKDESMDMKVYK